MGRSQGSNLHLVFMHNQHTPDCDGAYTISGQPPEVSSYHWAGFATNDSTTFLDEWEKAFNDPAGSIQQVEALKRKTGQATEMVLNEFIPFVNDWCDLDTVPVKKGSPPATSCPNSQDPAASGNEPNLQKAKGTGINRKTWAWNSAVRTAISTFFFITASNFRKVPAQQFILSPKIKKGGLCLLTNLCNSDALCLYETGGLLCVWLRHPRRTPIQVRRAGPADWRHVAGKEIKYICVCVCECVRACVRACECIYFLQNLNMTLPIFSFLSFIFSFHRTTSQACLAWIGRRANQTQSTG